MQLTGTTGTPFGEKQTYAAMTTPAGLRNVASYADWLGPDKAQIFPRAADGTTGAATPLIRDAHAARLSVVPYTFRAENQFLPAQYRHGTDPNAYGDLLAELKQYMTAGVDGFFTDQSDLGFTGARGLPRVPVLGAAPGGGCLVGWRNDRPTGVDRLRDDRARPRLRPAHRGRGLVTDSELNVLGEGVDIVIGATAEQLERMPEVVREMHRSSGLTDEVLASTVTVRAAEEQVLAYLKEWIEEPRKAPLCGNSIGTDRGFITRDMAELDEFLHYRIVDVSSVRSWRAGGTRGPTYNSPTKAGGHRALADILESIKELKYYRSTVFVPQPGPTSAEAAAAATALSEPVG